MKLELTEGDSLEGFDDTPMYNPHILPLKGLYTYFKVTLDLKNL